MGIEKSTKLSFWVISWQSKPSFSRVLCPCTSHCPLTEIVSMLPGYKSAQIVVECCDSPCIIGSAYLYSHSWMHHFYLRSHVFFFFFPRTSLFLGVESIIFIKTQFRFVSVNGLKTTLSKLNGDICQPRRTSFSACSSVHHVICDVSWSSLCE